MPIVEIDINSCPARFQKLIEEIASYFKTNGFNVTKDMFRVTYDTGSYKALLDLEIAHEKVFSTAHPEATALMIYAIDEDFNISIMQEQAYLLKVLDRFRPKETGRRGSPAVYSFDSLNSILIKMFPLVPDPEDFINRYKQAQMKKYEHEIHANRKKEEINAMVQRWAESNLPGLVSDLQEIDQSDLLTNNVVAQLATRIFDTTINALLNKTPLHGSEIRSSIYETCERLLIQMKNVNI